MDSGIDLFSESIPLLLEIKTLKLGKNNEPIIKLQMMDYRFWKRYSKNQKI